MGARADALAKRFEGKVQEATTVFEKLSDADWKKVTSAEKRSVGVVAHHVAMGHEGIGRIASTVSPGEALPHFPKPMPRASNSNHAQEPAARTTPAPTA